MARKAIRSALLPVAALLFGLGAVPADAASLGTTENTRFISVWLHPGLGLTAPDAPALLNMPPGWMSGDAMAVIAPGGEWPPGLRDQLVWALLDSGTAVLEVNEVRAGPSGEQALRTEMQAALRTAREALGAGLVVVIGRGAAGDAALELLDAGAESEAVAIRLGPEGTGFHLAHAPSLAAFPERPEMLCALLGAAQAADEPDIAAACRAAILMLR